MDWLVEIVVDAFPWLEGWISQARVVVTAKPLFGLPTWMLGLIGAGFLTWAWYELRGKV